MIRLVLTDVLRGSEFVIGLDLQLRQVFDVVSSRIHARRIIGVKLTPIIQFHRIRDRENHLLRCSLAQTTLVLSLGLASMRGTVL
jgi:hypothetical protein